MNPIKNLCLLSAVLALTATAAGPSTTLVNIPSIDTAVQAGPANRICRFITFQSVGTNTAPVCIGDQTVNCTSNPGVVLDAAYKSYTTPPMQTASLNQNMDLWFLTSGTANQNVSVTCVQ